jgi:two-component system, OmpR family, response regulator CpxR
MPLMAVRLLMIDDDVELCELVSTYLAGEGFEVEAAHTPAAGVDRALSGGHALVILDVMLPGASGFDVLRQIRIASPLPVLMLTAKGDTLDRVVGLELGADDYLSKPFNPQELAARLRAVLRRAAPQASPRSAARVADGDIEVDPGSRSVRRGGVPIEMTTVEFDLLETLVKAAGQVVSRESLVRDVLGRAFSPFDRSIDTHVYNLRRKLGPHADGTDRIKGIRGIGYLYTRATRTG